MLGQTIATATGRIPEIWRSDLVGEASQRLMAIRGFRRFSPHFQTPHLTRQTSPSTVRSQPGADAAVPSEPAKRMEGPKTGWFCVDSWFLVSPLAVSNT